MTYIEPYDFRYAINEQRIDLEQDLIRLRVTPVNRRDFTFSFAHPLSDLQRYAAYGYRSVGEYVDVIAARFDMGCVYDLIHAA